jgi:hypothetical protein
MDAAWVWLFWSEHGGGLLASLASPAAQVSRACRRRRAVRREGLPGPARRAGARAEPPPSPAFAGRQLTPDEPDEPHPCRVMSLELNAVWSYVPGGAWREPGMQASHISTTSTVCPVNLC